MNLDSSPLLPAPTEHGGSTPLAREANHSDGGVRGGNGGVGCSGGGGSDRYGVVVLVVLMSLGVERSEPGGLGRCNVRWYSCGIVAESGGVDPGLLFAVAGIFVSGSSTPYAEEALEPPGCSTHWI